MFLFKKKSCFVCGEKVGFSALRLAGDEKICSKCEALLRGNYNLVRRGAAFYDTLSELDPFYAKQIIEEMRATQKEDIAHYDGVYSGIVSIINKAYVPSQGLEEGGEEIACLCGKPVFIGFCEKGSFQEGDKIKVIGKDCEEEATIIKLIPCTGAYPFEEELIANAYEKQCGQNSNAWIILDISHDNVGVCDKIVKS